MNDALCRGAWDKGCTDIKYMAIEYDSKLPNNLPSYTTTKGKLCEYVVIEKFEFPLNFGTRILTTATQYVTIELRRPFTVIL